MTSLDDALLQAARIRLAPLVLAQGGVFGHAQALAAGLTAAHVRTLVRRGTWVSLRRGLLAEATDDRLLQHQLACTAYLRGRDPLVVSHLSAWALYRLPLDRLPARPTLTRAWQEGRGSPYGTRVAVLPDEHVVRFAGLPVTCGPRTVVDVLRTATDVLDAQHLADAAVRAGVEREPVEAMLRWCAGWPGLRQAREAWEGADARAESPLESHCRVWFRRGGLPVPASQVELRLGQGGSARVDFFFRKQRTVVEADGRVKYTDPRSGDAASVLWREKQREDRVRDLGLEVVRATWDDRADDGADLVRRVVRAFDRAARRGDGGWRDDLPSRGWS